MKRHPGPLCIDCRFFWSLHATCCRPTSATPSPVTGLHFDELRVSARSERKNKFTMWGRPKCGPEGKYFIEGRNHAPPPPVSR